MCKIFCVNASRMISIRMRRLLGLREALARAAGAESFAALEKQLVRTQVAVLDLFKATISDPAEKAE